SDLAAELAPGDGGALVLVFLERNVAAGAGLDGDDRLDRAVATGEVDKVLAADRSGDRRFRLLRQPPQLRARLRVVAAGELGRVGHDLRALGGAPDDGGTPGRDFVPRRGPDLFAV